MDVAKGNAKDNIEDQSGNARKENEKAEQSWDAGNMGCGELVMELRNRFGKLSVGSVLKLIATDPGAVEDIPSWCRMTGNQLETAQHPEYRIRKTK